MKNKTKQKAMQHWRPEGFDERQSKTFQELQTVCFVPWRPGWDWPAEALLPTVAMDTLPGPGFKAAEKTAAAKGEKDREKKKKKRKEGKQRGVREGEQGGMEGGREAAAGLCIEIKNCS